MGPLAQRNINTLTLEKAKDPKVVLSQQLSAPLDPTQHTYKRNSAGLGPSKPWSRRVGPTPGLYLSRVP